MAQSDIIALQNDPNSPINKIDEDFELKPAVKCLLCDEYINQEGGIIEKHDLIFYDVEIGFCSDECEEIYKEDYTQ